MSRIRKLTRLAMETMQDDQIEEAQHELEVTETPVEDISELVQSKADAEAARDYIEEVNDIHEELSDVREVTEVLNNQGGLSVESFAFFNREVNHICRRTGIKRPTQLPKFRDFKGGKRVKVSIEALDAMLSRIEDGTRRLEVNSVETVERLVSALTESLPNAHDRIKHVLELADAVEQREDRPDCTGKYVLFGDGLHIALSVDGEVPATLTDYLHSYLQLGQQLMCDYQNKAFEGAMKAVGIPDLLTYDSSDNFWVNVDKIVCDIEDPRRELTEAQRALILPNGESLFDNATCEDKEGEHRGVSKLRKFVECSRINEQINNPKGMAPVPKGQAGYGRLCLPLSDLREMAQAFDKLLCKIDINAFAERSNGIRQDMFGVINRAREGFANAPNDVKVQLTDHFNLVLKYLNTIYSLADWPVLNYLSNLVFTTNAFVLYAERCLALPDGEVEAPNSSEAIIAEATADNAETETDTDTSVEIPEQTAPDVVKEDNPSQELEEQRQEEDATNPIPDTGEEETDATGEETGEEESDEGELPPAEEIGTETDDEDGGEESDAEDDSEEGEEEESSQEETSEAE